MSPLLAQAQRRLRPRVRVAIHTNSVGDRKSLMNGVRRGDVPPDGHEGIANTDVTLALGAPQDVLSEGFGCERVRAFFHVSTVGGAAA